MKLKILILVALVLVIIGAVLAQELLDIDDFKVCTPEQAQDALDLMSEWLILETVDQIIEEMDARTLPFTTALYNFYLVRQSYFVEVRPNLPECAAVTLFDRDFSQWMMNTALNMSIAAMAQSDEETFGEWTVFIDNMETESQVLYAHYGISRAILEANAEADE
jgi:hypothetical protein